MIARISRGDLYATFMERLDERAGDFADLALVNAMSTPMVGVGVMKLGIYLEPVGLIERLTVLLERCLPIRVSGIQARR